jgi:hypothetical protein
MSSFKPIMEGMEGKRQNSRAVLDSLMKEKGTGMSY